MSPHQLRGAGLGGVLPIAVLDIVSSQHAFPLLLETALLGTVFIHQCKCFAPNDELTYNSVKPFLLFRRFTSFAIAGTSDEGVGEPVMLVLNRVI